MKIAVGLSGGVDSSVTALILKNKGYNVTGVYIQCWDAKADGCRSEEDRQDAVRVAKQLGIKFLSLDFRSEYKNRVISYFYDEYKKGRTPNPDIMCNKEIKFGLFYDWALNNGFDYVATGHYARIDKSDNEYHLKMGLDRSKDQSYFLYELSKSQLPKILFPIGDYKKVEIRKIAEESKLHTFNKPDSVGICFIGEVNIKEFLQKEIKPKVGDVINTKNEVIGEHDGVWFYTIGQRHGFRINKYTGIPVYVIGKDVKTNRLIVGHAREAQSQEFKVENLNWLEDYKQFNDITVRIRHLGELYKCNLEGSDIIRVKLEKNVFGIAPGQSAVFYFDDLLLGGGIIT